MKKIFIILFLFQPVLIFSLGNNWYVSTASAGNASGDSWTNKRIITTFNWSQVTPGDVVYVDGGTDSLVYNIASFAPTTHGTALNPIIITKGVDAGHNGTPVFLDNNGGVLVTISDITYTTIQHLKFKGKTSANGDCWLIDFSGSPHDVTFQYCTIDLNWSGGISCESDANSYNIKFLHNTITEWMNVSGYSTDLFWLAGSNNHDWELGWNTLIHKNPQTGGGAHRDMIQFAWSFQGVGGTTKIHHNYFDNRSAGTAGACIESHSIGGAYEIYDNIWKSNAIGLNGTGSWSMVSLTANRVYDTENGIPPITGIVSLKFYNNTIYTTTAANSMLFIRGFDNVDVRNNIFYAPAGVDDYGYFIGTDLYTQTHTQLWDYNQYYFSGGSYLIAGSCDDAQGVPCGGGSYTFAQWRVAGHDAHSTFNTNTPDFVNPSGTTATDYALQLGSEGINDGTAITFVADDYSGVNRPQGSQYDIGAFEYTENIIDTTAPNLQGAVLNNSTILILNFSESLNPTTAQNIINYSINNGINIVSVSLSGSQVTLTTSEHTAGNYLITVSNVTDLAGNVINPNNNTATYVNIVDLTPPQVISAAIIDSVSLDVYFSENLESSSAQNINNYVINGISITNATLNANVVRLSTSTHTNGLYQVTVINVTDVAGNLISSQNNSYIYEYSNLINNMLRLNIFQAKALHWYENLTPDKTIDGITSGESRWGGAISMPDTIDFSLDDIQILNSTKLSFYNWDGGRIYNYSILVSLDSISWNQIRNNISSQPQEWSIEEVDPIEAKYIKIILLSNNQNVYAELCEAEFWGHLKLPTNLEDQKLTPNSFVLEQNYPNPFNPSTKISWQTPVSSYHTIKVYDVLGNEVATLVDEFKPAGSYEVEFSASNLASGVYIYRIQTSEFNETKKMILLR